MNTLKVRKDAFNADLSRISRPTFDHVVSLLQKHFTVEQINKYVLHPVAATKLSGRQRELLDTVARFEQMKQESAGDLKELYRKLEELSTDQLETIVAYVKMHKNKN